MQINKLDDKNVIRVFMVHEVYVGKRDPIKNFQQYLDKLMEEFQYELARTVYPAMPPTTSHIIVPDESELKKY